MSLSINLPACLLRSLSASRTGMLKKLNISAIALAACSVGMAHADARLTYELTGADASKTVKQFSVARFFVRIDDSADEKRYLLYQAGKFFPVFAVDEAQQTYTRITPPVTAYMGAETLAKQAADANSSEIKPAEHAPTPVLKATNRKRSVAGIRCRVVHELLDGKPVAEHCMANSANLGITNRELITLSRLFAMSRDRKFGWPGVSTEDEEFVSVQSRDLRDNRVLQLLSISTQPLEAGYLRIPRSYQELAPDTNSK